MIDGYQPGDPLFHCRCCDGLILGAHWSARDCPAFDHEPAVIVEIAEGEVAEIFAWMPGQGWTDDGHSGPGYYPGQR